MIKILIVDDSPFFQWKLAEFLRDSGYTDLLFASNGAEALTMLSAREHDKPPVGLVISDIVMPVMDGLKLRERIRSSEFLKSLPILLVSAYDDIYTPSGTPSPFPEGFLKKNDVTTKLLQSIRSLTVLEERPLS